MQKYYVTTAIDYVNAPPHIGHAYEKIAADILARYYRLCGREVFFLTGVDEHGLKVEQAAQKAGMTPQEFCNQMAAKFESAWKKLNVSYDRFIRTTEDAHTKVVQELFQKLKDKGDVYKDSYSGLYCDGCEDYLRERDLDVNGHCPNHRQPPKLFVEENYFFALSKYKEPLKLWLSNDEKVVMPEGRRKEVLNQLEDEELGDFSITRSRSSLNWGIPVPNEPDQVIYVWIDALTNYLTGVGYLSNPTLCDRFWPADLHLIGKDITKFHAIYWPALLMSANLPLPKKIFGHGFITVEGQKMSKTLGNVSDPVALVDQYGADALRFFLFSATPFDQDGDFSRKELVTKVNAELANNLGNLLNRTLALVSRHCGGKIPAGVVDHYLQQEANTVHGVIKKHMEELEFAKAAEAILSLVDQANKYLNDQKPWSMFKEAKNKDGETVLYTVLEILRRVAIYLYPYTPNLAAKMWHQLGYAKTIEQSLNGSDVFFATIPVSQSVCNEGPIFMRIEDEV